MELNNIHNISTLGEYMESYGSALANHVKSAYQPLFNPGDTWDQRIESALRRPYQGQGDAIMAVREALKSKRAVSVVGEMGTGKTLMGALIPYVSSRTDRPRTLIMCPKHLTKKWKREIEKTVPGSRAYIVSDLADAKKVEQQANTAPGPVYWVISKERAKLDYSWRAAYLKKDRSERVIERIQDNSGNVVERSSVITITEVVCPRCGETVLDAKKTDADGAGLPIEESVLWKRKTACGHCGEHLWQADAGTAHSRRFVAHRMDMKKRAPRRFAVATYFKKKLPRNFFDFFICDEVHEMKGADTAQGNSFGLLAGIARKTLCLTGTLLGGHASHLFYLNFRADSREMLRAGYGYRKIAPWIDRYGVRETTITEHDYSNTTDNRSSRGKSRSSNTNEKAGISPELFAHWLMDSAVFVHLEDVAEELPPIDEDVIGVDMSPEVKAGYRDLEANIRAVMGPMLARGDRRLLGAFLQNLLSYPDKPFDNPAIDLIDHFYTPRDCNPDVIYPKEAKLLELCKSELAQGRRVLVYANFTGLRDVTARFKEILSRAGIKAEILRQSVDPEKREAWIDKKVEEGIEVLICNPELVKTGLDLIAFPTIVFMQTGYSIFTLRQASRRSWRIGQDRPVKVLYLYYKETMQARAVELIGRKLDASLAIEGKFTDKGLVAMSGSDDGSLALAKSLVNGGVEGVESVWKKLKDTARKAAASVVKTVTGTTGTTGTAEAVKETEPEPVETPAKPEPVTDAEPAETSETAVHEETEPTATDTPEPEKTADTDADGKHTFEPITPDANPVPDAVVAETESVRNPEPADVQSIAETIIADALRRIMPEFTTPESGETTEKMGVEHDLVDNSDHVVDAVDGPVDNSDGRIEDPSGIGGKPRIEKAAEAASESHQPAIVETTEQEAVGSDDTASGNAQEAAPKSKKAGRKSRRKSAERKSGNVSGKPRKKPTIPAWRLDANTCPGDPDRWKWTARGWRKISDREIAARIRREEEARMNAWKYERDSDPGEGFYWVGPYSYKRTLKTGKVKTIKVRGHWRAKPSAHKQVRLAA